MAVAFANYNFAGCTGLHRPDLKGMSEYRNMNYPWFALQVRSRYENVAAAHLSGKGFECFLPLYKSRRRWSDRFKEVECPLFPGYVFCRLNPLDRLPIHITPGVILIVGHGKTPEPIDETEIAAIQSVIKSGLSSQPYPFLQIGQRVRIDNGPLWGLEGVLQDFKGRHRLVLSVTLLRRSIAVQLEDSWVTPILQHQRISTEPASASAVVL
jgi:transcription antitermination factor NusG